VSWAVSITGVKALDGPGTGELAEDSLILPRHGSEFTYSDLLQFHAPSTKARVWDAVFDCGRAFIKDLLLRTLLNPKLSKSRSNILYLEAPRTQKFCLGGC